MALRSGGSVVAPSAVKDRWIAVGVLFAASLLGVLLPFFWAAKKWLSATWFQFVRIFCTGLICGVAMLHVLADADEFLSKVVDYPAANGIALFGIFVMVMIKEFGQVFMRSLDQKDKDFPAAAKPSGHDHLDEPLISKGSDSASTTSSDCQKPSSTEKAHRSDHHHSHDLSLPLHMHKLPSSIELQGVDFAGQPLRRVIVYAMEASIGVHSVLVGVALGVLRNRSAIVSLCVALIFHQFFEGVALGATAAKAKLTVASAWHLVLVFTLSCPAGGILGIYVAKKFDESDPSTAWVLGTLNALAAGTLLHMGLAELLPEDFSEVPRERCGAAFSMARLIALFFGGLVMAVLAIWA